ncbi:hypothetical protein RSK20926_18547 [Roseobacter sp. SK209-2-6]|uniref:DUF6456 domain-containing protein n=1 Tax=Roseobacter sp. SK209-2-6 TaxID=388739 RepID=UPI0000F3F6BE|nr:DUF6456 domain-containing protein [Roseobacter sp. SK209-2-6]EBA17766.1 hypothetical protein RSK20926_18547 [Roseobacter sp. SK209-2-6]
MQRLLPPTFPEWAPEEVHRYLQHTEAGTSIRQLAREAGCHPSTILRQVRRLEARRDDALIDRALQELAPVCQGQEKPAKSVPYQAKVHLENAALAVLSQLCRSGAVLAVAESMEKAVVVREGGAAQHSFSVDKSLAAILALLDWVTCTRSDRLSRYHITPLGRTVLNRLMAERENRARSNIEQGFAEGQTPFERVQRNRQRERRCRYGMGETPLDMLARLTDKTGSPYLQDVLVKAGKRLREDYELAQIGDHLNQEQAYFSEAPDCGINNSIRPNPATEAAKKRAVSALQTLGPGLNDIALRCCCHLEGLETAERHLGWSARSGKVVLRIALMQLQKHYEKADAQNGGCESNQMIG